MRSKIETPTKNFEENNSKTQKKLFIDYNIKGLPNADNFINIINDTDSEQISHYNDNLKNNQLRNDIIERKIINKKEKFKIIKIDKTINSDNINELNNLNLKTSQRKEKKDTIPLLYKFDKIKNEIFPKLQIKEEIKDCFIINEEISTLENRMSDGIFDGKKKRKKIEFKPKKDKKKLGRKRITDPLSEKGKHNKDSDDNIIKKIKTKIINYLISFVNGILVTFLENNKIILYIKMMKNNIKEKEPEIESLIKDLNYRKIVDNIKKENNLKLLNQTLKELLSNDISPKYLKLKPDWNKKIIENILEKEKENKIIEFIFNLTFREWFDIFTYKKELKDLGFSDEKNIKKIMDNLMRVDKLLEEVYNLNFGNKYFSIFTSFIYNYERWFFIKQGRNKKIKIIKEEDEKYKEIKKDI